MKFRLCYLTLIALDQNDYIVLLKFSALLVHISLHLNDVDLICQNWRLSGHTIVIPSTLEKPSSLASKTNMFATSHDVQQSDSSPINITCMLAAMLAMFFFHGNSKSFKTKDFMHQHLFFVGRIFFPLCRQPRMSRTSVKVVKMNYERPTGESC